MTRGFENLLHFDLKDGKKPEKGHSDYSGSWNEMTMSYWLTAVVWWSKAHDKPKKLILFVKSVLFIAINTGVCVKDMFFLNFPKKKKKFIPLQMDHYALRWRSLQKNERHSLINEYQQLGMPQY